MNSCGIFQPCLAALALAFAKINVFPPLILKSGLFPPFGFPTTGFPAGFPPLIAGNPTPGFPGFTGLNAGFPGFTGLKAGDPAGPGFPGSGKLGSPKIRACRSSSM